MLGEFVKCFYLLGKKDEFVFLWDSQNIPRFRIESGMTNRQNKNRVRFRQKGP
jgi:hypothetical protein